MSGGHKITCKKECYKCKFCNFYLHSHKYPWLCSRPRNGIDPFILTVPNCGKVFTPPSKELKSCKFYKEEEKHGH
jgi:hypothetical protein